MRNEFAKTITELAKVKKDIVLLAGDIGNRLFDNFKKNNPERFYNCGVAEANMTGVASGLASSGFKTSNIYNNSI
jgi:transketolase